MNLLARKYRIPRTTIYYWIKDVPISDQARLQLKANSDKGRELGRATMLRQRQDELTLIHRQASSVIESLKLKSNLAKVMCSLLFWAEGAKDTSSVAFINSDPVMIETFLSLFRRAFKADESKFRVLVHLHSYHDQDVILNFWSEVTNIPRTQFYKPYQKQNSGKTKKEGYKGCICLSYFDAKIAKEMYWLYTTLHQKVVTI